MTSKLKWIKGANPLEQMRSCDAIIDLLLSQVTAHNRRIIELESSLGSRRGPGGDEERAESGGRLPARYGSGGSPAQGLEDQQPRAKDSNHARILPAP